MLPAFLLVRFVCNPYNRLKNLSAAVNATRNSTRILIRGRGLQPKLNFFAQKSPEQTDATQACHRRGPEGGAEPPATGEFL